MSVLICPPHLPEHRIRRAVEVIQHHLAPKRAAREGWRETFPDDLGCETQLYLAAALFWSYPCERITVVAACCGVDVPDALFFAELVELALGSSWMQHEVIEAAQRAVLGLPPSEALPVRHPRAAIFGKGLHRAAPARAAQRGVA